MSSVDLPVEPDSLPLHIVGQEPPDTELAVVRYVLEHPALWNQYQEWLLTLHPVTWEEIRRMARTAKKSLGIDFRPAIEHLGLEEVLRQAGIDAVIDQVGLDRIVKHFGKTKTIDELLANLPKDTLEELKRRLQNTTRTQG